MTDVLSNELFTTTEIIASEDNLPTEIEVLQEGAWKDMPGRPDFSISASDLDEFATNVNSGVRPGIAINVEHDTDPVIGKQAAGWIKGAVARLNDKGKAALFVKPDWNSLGKTLVGDKRFRFVSGEFVPASLGGQPDAEGKGMLRNVLKKVTLTNSPLMKDLPAIMASEDKENSISGLTIQLTAPIINSSEGNQTLDLKAILSKEVSEISAEEKVYLTEHKSELSAAEAEKFLGDGKTVKAGEDEVVVKASELAAKDKEIEELKAQVKASEATTDERIAKLEVAANAGVKASEELAKTKAEAVVDEHIKRGAVKPDQRDFWTGQLIKASEEDRPQIEAALKELPANEVLATEAKGDTKAGEAGGGASKQLIVKTDEIIKASEGKMDFTKALLQARAENSVLASEADAEAANGEVS